MVAPNVAASPSPVYVFVTVSAAAAATITTEPKSNTAMKAILLIFASSLLQCESTILYIDGNDCMTENRFL